MKTKQSVRKNELSLFSQNRYNSNILENIGQDKDMLNLTDLWREAGSPANKRPIDWKEKESTVEFIDALSDTFQSAKIALWKTKRGGSNPGTYGIRQIFLAYAKYLDPALHILVNEVFFERVEEEKNPDLIVDRAIATYRRKGKDDVWIGQRLKSKGARNVFTRCLAKHKVEGTGYRDCTNAIYEPLWGGTAAIVRAKKNLPGKVNIRDAMSREELAGVEFAEILATNRITANNLTGNTQCETACLDSSRKVAQLIVESRRVTTGKFILNH